MKAVRRTEAASPLMPRLYSAGVVFGTVFLVGGLGYRLIGRGRWDYSDCFYMAVVTLSTVGFAETLPDMDQVPGARIWTVGLILLGSGTLLYFASTLTALIVEGDLRGALQRNKMRRLLDAVENHIIVCGVGATGSHVLGELIATRHPVVVIDTDIKRIERLTHEVGSFLHVIGDATEDEVLDKAGIHRARGLVACLTEDRDNLFVSLTARALNDGLRIVSKTVDSENAAKMRRAGADAVVSPAFIGGVRIASEMVRPTVVRFLDEMLRDPAGSLRIEEVPVAPGSPLEGSTLAQAQFRDRTETLVIAIRHPDGTNLYNPGPDTLLCGGQTLIVLAHADQVARVHATIRGG